jgi:hypothetical protein
VTFTTQRWIFDVKQHATFWFKALMLVVLAVVFLAVCIKVLFSDEEKEQGKDVAASTSDLPHLEEYKEPPVKTPEPTFTPTPTSTPTPTLTPTPTFAPAPTHTPPPTPTPTPYVPNYTYLSALDWFNASDLLWRTSAL